MDNIRKVKIKEVMIKTLEKNIGYPKCQEGKILEQLKPMWIALEEAGLTTGLSYQLFCEHAQSQAMMASIKKMFM